MKEGKQEVGRGVATCNPGDEFDFKTGAKLAMDRLLGEEEKKASNEVREVSRKAKIGEYIKIVKKGNHGPRLVIGDIHKVTNATKHCIDTDKSNVFHNYETHEYVVLENYNPEKAEPKATTKPEESTDEYLSYKKVNRRAKVGEYMLVINAENVPGDDYKNGDILKCIGIEYDYPSYADGVINDKSRVLTAKEYVVLEGYQPPKSFGVLTKEEVLKAVNKALEK